MLCNAPPQAGRDVGAPLVRRNPGEGGILARAPPASGKGKTTYNLPQLPILHPIRAEPLNHIAYLTHKYFCSYKKLFYFCIGDFK